MTPANDPARPPSSPIAALRSRWPLYLMEAAELACFMLSACVFTVVLFHPASPILRLVPDATLRRAIMGVAMGLTAILIIRSPWGRRSGAHFNPAITLTFFRLGKIGPFDAIFYIVAHFAGGILGVGLSALVLRSSLADPAVNYAVTVPILLPGLAGPAAAFAAEFFMAALLMAVVLFTSNRPALAPYTTFFVGVLIAFYILLFAPISGFSINPARTLGSAVFAHLYTSLWIYFTAPPLGMLLAAGIYLRTAGPHPRHLRDIAHLHRTGQHYFTHRHLTQR